MDVKTLSAVIGHVSATTKLDIYTHITDSMQQAAADSIDRGIGKAKRKKASKKNLKTPSKSTSTNFQPYKGERRKSGTGCISQISKNLWEGRYSPIWPDEKNTPTTSMLTPERSARRNWQS